jgi:diadenylate cyclase
MSGGHADTAREVLLSPGAPLRSAVEEIAASGSGALIVVGDEAGVEPLGEGGFDVDERLTRARLVELASIDGAVVLGDGVSSILRANVHLQPDRALPTSVTGIRHRTAERLSRETDALVIAVSATGEVAVYCGGARSTLP